MCRLTYLKNEAIFQNAFNAEWKLSTYLELWPNFKSVQSVEEYI